MHSIKSDVKKDYGPDLPPFLSELLSEHGIEAQDVLFVTVTDMCYDLTRCDSYLVITEDFIYVISGSITLSPDPSVKIHKNPKLKRSFMELEFKSFSKSELTMFRVEELISTVQLTAQKSDTTSVLIAVSTKAMANNLREASDFLNANPFESTGETSGINQNLNSADIRREDGASPEKNSAHSGVPGSSHGENFPPQAHNPKTENPLICPKCGKKYTDPSRKICLKCMNKRKIVKRIMSFLFKYKLQIFVSVLVLILTSALSIITPYISSGFYYDQVLDEAGEFYGQLILVMILIISTKILTTAVTIISNVTTGYIAAYLKYDLKNVIFSSIERLSMSFFTGEQTGTLMTQVTRDSDTIFYFFCTVIPYFLVNAVQIISISVIMIIMKPELALMYLATVPIVFIFITRLFSSMGNLHGKRYRMTSRMNALLSDTFSGIRIVKAFSREKASSERFEKISGDAAEADRRASEYSTLKFPIVEIIMGLSQIMVLGVGGWMVVTGNLTYGTLLTFFSYTTMIYNPMFQFVHMSYQATDSINAMGRLVEVMEAEPEVNEIAAPVSKEKFLGKVEFNNVDFGYDKSRNVLFNINFKVEPHSILGIVGHTGAGKSTIANLLIRLYDATHGEILIDDIPIKNIAFKDLRNNIAIVSQETYLFVGTILENIRYAKPDASLNDIISASIISGAHDFIIKLPDAYDTMIGFGHRDLSGGERQRVSIARAILRNPSILILDEATAAMDTQTERKIQSALENLIKGKTTIMIAHRLSTLRSADKLIVLKDGRICENGTHDELIKAKGEYFKLYSLQLAALKNIGVEE